MCTKKTSEASLPAMFPVYLPAFPFVFLRRVYVHVHALPGDLADGVFKLLPLPLPIHHLLCLYSVSTVLEQPVLLAHAAIGMGLPALFIPVYYCIIFHCGLPRLGAGASSSP